MLDEPDQSVSRKYGSGHDHPQTTQPAKCALPDHKDALRGRVKSCVGSRYEAIGYLSVVHGVPPILVDDEHSQAKEHRRSEPVADRNAGAKVERFG